MPALNAILARRFLPSGDFMLKLDVIWGTATDMIRSMPL
jgi:hypothetical protein